jgi:hypothetical protein
LDYIVGVMRDSNSPQPNRLKAAEILLERGYGKPHVSVEISAEHKFAVVPKVMGREEWLATKGAGYEVHRMELELERLTAETAATNDAAEPEAEVSPIDPDKPN